MFHSIEKNGDITLVTFTNSLGATVTLSSLGAGIVEMIVPDSLGNLADVILGYANPADYMADGPCAGKCPGRFANRIGAGRFSLDGNEYRLAINNGPNALHGGPTGFQNQLWDVNLDRAVDGEVLFTLNSPDGHEGYPGNLHVEVRYRWEDTANRLTITFNATTDRPTVVNLTNHSYWNLDGEGTSTILNHRLRLCSSRYLVTDRHLLPTGELAPVAGTPMDFTTPRLLGERINDDFPALKFGKGYDNCWVVDCDTPGALQEVACLESAASGRRLTIASTQPGVQVYTGNWLDGSPVAKSGRSYRDYEGVAIECQGFPDAPNKPSFPSCRLNPGETYHQVISFTFDTVDDESLNS